jgi:TonB family protein
VRLACFAVCLLLGAGVEAADTVPPRFEDGRAPQPEWPETIRGSSREAIPFLTEGMQEGFVSAQATVDAEGNIEQVEVLDSFGGPAFEYAAVKTLKRTPVLPATIDGVPAEGTLTASFWFPNPDGPEGARENFRAALARCESDLQSNRLAVARACLEGPDFKDPVNFYEAAHHSLRLAILEEAEGDLDASAHLLTDVAILGMQSFPRDQYRSALQTAVGALFKSGRFGDVVWLIDMLKSAEADDALRLLEPVIAELDRVRSEPGGFFATFKLPADGHWRSWLLKRTVQLKGDPEQIESTRFACEAKILSARFASVTVQLPEEFGDCMLHIQGKPGAEIVVRQMTVD